MLCLSPYPHRIHRCLWGAFVVGPELPPISWISAPTPPCLAPAPGMGAATQNSFPSVLCMQAPLNPPVQVSLAVLSVVSLNFFCSGKLQAVQEEPAIFFLLSSPLLILLFILSVSSSLLFLLSYITFPPFFDFTLKPVFWNNTPNFIQITLSFFFGGGMDRSVLILVRRLTHSPFKAVTLTI